MTGVDTEPRKSPWPDYYRAQMGREPRELLLDGLARMRTVPGFAPGYAIDLGCGSGIETAALAERGWRVLAIDKHAGFEEWLRSGLPEGTGDAVETRVAPFEAVELPACDLLHASYSLPFCTPAAFPRLWQHARAALRPGAWLIANFFGPDDTWAQTSGDVMNFHSASEIYALLDGLEVRRFVEDRHDGDSLSGPKHWHIFDVIARRPE